MLTLLVASVALTIGSLVFPARTLAVLRDGHALPTWLIVLTVVVVYTVHKLFGAYAQSPQSAQPYLLGKRSPWPLVAFWSAAVGWLIVVILAIGHMRSIAG